MRKVVWFIALYLIFATINIVYFIWTAVLTSDVENGYTEVKDPCVLSVMYALNTALIGTYVSLVFGLTKENIKLGRKFVKKIYDNQ